MSDYARDETAWSAADESALHQRADGAYAEMIFNKIPSVRVYRGADVLTLTPDEAKLYAFQMLAAVAKLNREVA